MFASRGTSSWGIYKNVKCKWWLQVAYEDKIFVEGEIDLLKFYMYDVKYD